MANEEQLAILKQGAGVWNEWRKDNPDSEVDLKGADLSRAALSETNLDKADLSKANLSEANLSGAHLNEAELSFTNFFCANLRGAYLNDAYLLEADLRQADLRGTYLEGHAHLRDAKLAGAKISNAHLRGAYLGAAKLQYADLSGSDVSYTNLWGADLEGASLCSTLLEGANLSDTNITGANLTGANLNRTQFVGTTVSRAVITGSSVYGINVWDLKGEFKEQSDLIVTSEGEPVITVDDVNVAQLIYLMLYNENIKKVIDTITSRSVLILGRFSHPERKEILDALRRKLREYKLLSIVFDFDRPSNRDLTETIKILVGQSYFVIADITNPKSSPLELQATVPDYQIPFVPIIQEGEKPFAMMVDLQNKYNWVLDTLSYKSIDELIKALKPAIIDPAIQKHNELRLIKAREPKIRSASDFIDDKGLS